MKLALKFIILFLFISGYSQESENFDLELSYTGTKDYKIDIKAGKENTFMIASKPYATTFPKNDSIEIQRLLKINTKNAKKKLFKIVENNTKYKRDTVVIPNGNTVMNYVYDLVKNWKTIEEDLKLNPDKRIILDGYTVKLSLMKDHLVYEDIYAHSPTKESHPEIFELISELEKYYNKESKKLVLN